MRFKSKAAKVIKESRLSKRAKAESSIGRCFEKLHCLMINSIERHLDHDPFRSFSSYHIPLRSLLTVDANRNNRG